MISFPSFSVRGSDGRIFATGEWGPGLLVDNATFTEVTALAGYEIVRMKVGYDAGHFLLADGSLLAWGSNPLYASGVSLSPLESPTVIPLDVLVASITAPANTSSCIRTVTGDVVCSGLNSIDGSGPGVIGVGESDLTVQEGFSSRVLLPDVSISPPPPPIPPPPPPAPSTPLTSGGLFGVSPSHACAVPLNYDNATLYW